MVNSNLATCLNDFFDISRPVVAASANFLPVSCSVLVDQRSDRDKRVCGVFYTYMESYRLDSSVAAI